LRISFAGGGTDLSPFVDEHGGHVLNATINRYAYATLRFPDEVGIAVESLDYHDRAHYSPEQPLLNDGKFDLIKACLRRLHSAPDHGGIELYLETDAPPGSGLGASSALVVALIGALKTWRKMPLEPYEVARLAWEIERKDVGVPGGFQDQYASTFGGFNFIEFRPGGDVIVNPLRIEPRVLLELQYNLLLVFTGRTRTSAAIIEKQISGYVDNESGVLEAMSRMKALTIDAKDAILTGRLDRLGDILDAEWTEKKKTAEGVTTPRIEEMYAEARRLGALGGKASGAGGGGYMFLYCPFDRKPAISKRLEELGGEICPIAFESSGMQAWAWS
jgi:D-glycero-alpha-D-manno-heptose-7-phosphate kinase